MDTRMSGPREAQASTPVWPRRSPTAQIEQGNYESNKGAIARDCQRGLCACRSQRVEMTVLCMFNELLYTSLMRVYMPLHV